MSTAYLAGKSASTTQSRALIDITSVFETYALTGALVINDTIAFFKLPAGATVLEMILTVDSMDSSTGVVFQVGDSGSATRYIAATTIGQSSTAGVVRLNQNAGMNYLNATETTVVVKVSTAPSGTAATTGNIRLACVYTMAQ